MRGVLPVRNTITALPKRSKRRCLALASGFVFSCGGPTLLRGLALFCGWPQELGLAALEAENKNTFRISQNAMNPPVSQIGTPPQGRTSPATMAS